VIASTGCLLLLSPALRAQEAEEERLAAADQVVVASQLNAAAERAARLTQEAAQKVAEAVRAHRRAEWMTRTAKAVKRHDRQGYLAARRGSELARLDREAKNREAKAAVGAGIGALDAIDPLADSLKDPDTTQGRDMARASNRVVEAATAVKDAARPVKESLREVDAVRVRLELSGRTADERRSARIEEAVARRRLAVNDSIGELATASQQLAAAGEGLQHAGAQPATAAAKRGRKGFGGLGAGVGLGFTFDVGGKDRVDTARIIETKDASGAVSARTLRVDKSNNDIPHVMLEAHYFLVNDDPMRMPWCNSSACADLEREGSSCWMCGYSIPKEHFGIGPYVGVQPGSSDVIDAVGGGVMVGLRTDSILNGDSVNLGLGYFADPNTRVLGDGFSENQSPPPGETQVRYKDVTKSGVMLQMSYGF
jgi:hypothetical protein